MLSSDLLFNLASKSPMQSKFAACLIYKNKIISMAFNNYSGQFRCIKSNENKQCSLRALIQNM